MVKKTIKKSKGQKKTVKKVTQKQKQKQNINITINSNNKKAGTSSKPQTNKPYYPPPANTTTIIGGAGRGSEMINQPSTASSTPISNDIATILKAMVKSNSDFSGIGNLYSKLNKLDNRQSALESRLTAKYGWENDASDSVKVHYNEEDDVSEMTGYAPSESSRSYSYVDFFNPETLPEGEIPK